MPHEKETPPSEKERSWQTLVPAGLLFGLLFFVLRFPLIFSALAGTALFFAVDYLLKKRQTAANENPAASKSPNDLLQKARLQLNQLEDQIPRIQNVELQALLRQICSIARRILQKLDEKPALINEVRRFITYYLEATHNLLAKYLRVQNDPGSPQQSSERTQRLQQTLQTVATSFQRQLEKLLGNEWVDLDIEMKVLEQTLKAENQLP